ncbi:3'(2'),5'-bisphosphate nucleotidase CysQ [bacterium]|nr:3'(2'),5'-bisphosphate nucleotidase CysQ [bacterium]MBU1434173.1 3'(2'),5'-bisphosphate nucleotidase CysQ [bacterium]MBU1504268.1 3'(2'),5'-bisphosphate nucleotidase CysQ [bacterium]
MIEQIDIEDIKQIALSAGSAIMEIYKKDFSIEYKEDSSPLTEADKKSNEMICRALAELYPNIPIMSEENKQVDYETRKNWKYYWCIDPIDGTKEFIKKNDEFTVNIALIANHIPVLGVVYAPALHEIYYAKKGEGAFKNGQKMPLFLNSNPQESLTAVASKSHLSIQTQDFIDKIALTAKHIELSSKGSSLKLCMVAEGVADIYPRLAPTMEWDTAAAHAIVLESGKNVYIYDENITAAEYLTSNTFNLKCVLYNKENLLNPWFVVV